MHFAGQAIISILYFGAAWYFWDIWAALAFVVFCVVIGLDFEKTIENIKNIYDDEIYRLKTENAELQKQIITPRFIKGVRITDTERQEITLNSDDVSSVEYSKNYYHYIVRMKNGTTHILDSIDDSEITKGL